MRRDETGPPAADRAPPSRRPSRGPGRRRAAERGRWIRVPLLLSVLQLALAVPGTEGASRGPRSGASDAPGVQITFLVNEGFLLEGDGQAVLIDAFVEVQADRDGSLSSTLYEKMLAGKPPFASIPLALASHPHRDHFEPAVAGSFLARHPEVVLASSPDVLAKLRNSFPGYETVMGQLTEVRTRKHEIVTRTLSGIRVDFLQFDHEASAFFPLKVLGHIVHLGGRKILHVGDAELLPEQLAPYHLETRGIDVAFLPFWFFKLENAREILDEHIGAETLIAMRLPPAGVEEAVAEVSSRFPEVIFLETPLESIRF